LGRTEGFADSRLVDFDAFLKVLNRPGGFRDPGEPEEYCRGFQVFDKDMTGFIGVGQLRYSEFLSFSLTSMGIPRDQVLLQHTYG
jgi:Ca2+-binding EF-hand superfamily protein